MAAGHGEELAPSERLRAIILERFGTYRAFAAKLDPPMDPTQLSSGLKPQRRPEPETLDRFSVVLGWEPSRLRRWYGYEVNAEERPSPPMTIEDKRYDPARVIAFVESHPDDAFCATLAREKARRTTEGYEWLCFRIFRAWTSNAELAMDILIEAQREY